MAQSKPNVVNAADFSGWAMSLHPDGPKFRIVCGHCTCQFEKRIPRGSHLPRILCPACGTLNQLQLTYRP